MIDFASTNATRHAMLMDPATQFEGGQPVAVDSLYGIVTTTLIGGVRPVFMDFGADGALYVGAYSGSYYRFVNSTNAMAIYRFAFTGGQDTPGPDPKAIVPETSSVVQFNIGKSGGVSYTWDFGDDSPDVTTTEPTVTHTYDSAGDKTATLTVHYADGDAASKTVAVEDVPTPLFTNVDEEVGATVPMVLALTLGAPASFGAFTPSVDRDYTASTTASALATSGNAALSIADPATATTGRLVNGDYSAALEAAGQGHQRGREWLGVRRHRAAGQSDDAAHLRAGGQRPGHHGRVQAARVGHGRTPGRPLQQDPDVHAVNHRSLMSFTYKFLLALVVALAVPASAAAAPGSIRTLEHEEFGNVFMDASQTEPARHQRLDPSGRDGHVQLRRRGRAERPQRRLLHVLAPAELVRADAGARSSPASRSRRCPRSPSWRPGPGNCTFNNPGTYSFYCTVHGEMTGIGDRGGGAERSRRR